ncbi:hypothetical protein BSKO_11499 [Bryopsis sp. KO-2023]|nr:hypothetical protein BSKO_11499 [Bryopsis sp. KO-2023]
MFFIASYKGEQRLSQTGLSHEEPKVTAITTARVFIDDIEIAGDAGRGSLLDVFSEKLKSATGTWSSQASLGQDLHCIYRSNLDGEIAHIRSKQKKLMKSMKFPKELDLKVEPSKVNWVVMFEWVAKRVTELLGVEDEVLIHFIHNKLQAQKELWAMLASASTTASGIPQQILDEKAEELRKKKEIQDKKNVRTAKNSKEG